MRTLITALALAACSEGFAMTTADIPSAPPQDALMPPAADVAAVSAWFAAAFLGATSPNTIPIEVRRQDHSVLRFGRSCMDTPLRIASREFQRGLGTHANSELVVTLPEGARHFEAFVGIDNNDDTRGTLGSVTFAVEANGQTLIQTPLLKGGDEPFSIAVDIPEGTQQLILRVDSTPDGPSHDQADWADARVLLADGKSVYLDEGRTNGILADNTVPFSFNYAGRPSSEFLTSWTRDTASEDQPDFRKDTITWTDPTTGLKVTAEAKVFKQYAAAEWLLYLENTGSADTSLIENIQALDVALQTSNPHRTATLRRQLGDACNERSFLPAVDTLNIDQKLHFQPVGGRSSNFEFPFFNVEYSGQGLIAAIGWTGQWAVNLDRAGQSNSTRLTAGMEKTSLVLHPGERIRSPRILLMTWKDDLTAAHNAFRRLMLFQYVPRRDGKPLQLPVVLQCFDRYSWTVPEWATEQGQIEAVDAAHTLGFDAHWLDAAWFEGGFPNGVGNWYCKPKAFPNGLRPVSDACRERDMRFVLWFEPERVAKGTQIAQEHPDYVHGGADGGLFKLDDPAARAWLTDLLSKHIADFNLDVYRNDFNMDPLDYWRRNDAPDRQGMTEIRYVEGIYAMWDELLARKPGLMIDNCSSGGRRIDLEMCMRSVPFWRSDTSCSPGHPQWNQSQTLGLCKYVPLNMACGWAPDAYTVRSAATAGAIEQWDYRNPGFDAETGKASTAEVAANRKYWYGDFYPLLDSGNDQQAWSAFQFHRADLNEGMALVFRRDDSPYTAVALKLQALDPNATYTVELIDDQRHTITQTLTPTLNIQLPNGPSSLLIRYKKM